MFKKEMKPYQQKLFLELLDFVPNSEVFDNKMSSANKLDMLIELFENGLLDCPVFENYYNHGNGD